MTTIQNLNDLLDVSVPAPADGDVLYWDAAAAKWKAKPFVPGGGTVERVVRFSSDDVSAWWTGAAWAVNLTHSGSMAGYWSGSYQGYGAGLRFVNIYIPPGATIITAYLKLTCRNTDNSIEVKSRIHGQLDANPITFSNYADYDARVRTVAVITWDDIPTWTIDELYESPELKTIIQEIINLGAWASGNSLVIFWDDHELRTAAVNGKIRRARSWDHADPVPVMLYVEWVP